MIPTVRSIVRLGREKELSFLAAGVAFFAFLSITPGLLLVLALGSAVGGEQFASMTVELFATYLSEEGATVVREALSNRTGLVGASLVGITVLFWSALRVFRAINIAFDRIYGEDQGASLLRRSLDGAVVMVSIGVGTVLLLTARTVVALLGYRTFLYTTVISTAVLLVGLIVVLAPMYYVMPPVRTSVREILPGTVAAEIGLIVLHQGFHVYTSVADQYQAYGFLGAVLLFQLWLYFGSLVLLFGAVVNAASLR
jgi:membrane protein